MLKKNFDPQSIYATGAVIVAVLIAFGMLVGTVRPVEGAPIVLALLGTSAAAKACAKRRKRRHRTTGNSA